MKRLITASVISLSLAATASPAERYLQPHHVVLINDVFEIRHEPLIFYLGEQCYGLIDRKKREIRVSDVFSPEERREKGILHEFVHAIYPTLGEDDVRRAARSEYERLFLRKDPDDSVLRGMIEFLDKNHAPRETMKKIYKTAGQ